MPRQSKPFEYPLSDDIAQAVLNLAVEPMEEPPARTVRERLERAREAIREANAILADNPVAKIVAQSIMRQIKRRGDPQIAVRPDGTVVLRVNYGDQPQPMARTRRDAPVQSAHRGNLPYLDELRQQAAERGLDVSHLGQRRRAIHEYLEAHTEGHPDFDEVSHVPADRFTR